MGEMARSSKWLGFSLSSHMAMEAPSSSEPVPAHHPPPHVGTTMLPSPYNTIPCNFLFSSAAQMAAPSPGYYVGGAYGDGTTTAGVYYSHPHLPVMPVKSDGSLCNMEGHYCRSFFLRFIVMKLPLLSLHLNSLFILWMKQA
jgi:AP2-like factor, ANT lineage